MSETQNRIGFHYYPDDRHYRQQDLDRWLPVLRQLDAGWLTLRASGERSVPEFFLRGLLAAGIEPIVHLHCPVGSVRPSDLNPLLYSYAHWGVTYVVPYDRPNLRAGWHNGHWSPSGLVERFLDAVLPTLQAAASAGLTAVFPPLEPGGDYWDTAFLESALKGIARRGQQALFDTLALGAYGWTYGRPLDWGAGGPAAWPQARPYATPEDSQDQRAARTFEWYRQIAQAAVGRSLPTLVLAGAATDELGASASNGGGAAFDLRRMIQEEPAAEGLSAFCFYLLTSERSHNDASFAWYTESGEPTPVADQYLAATEETRATAKTSSDSSEKLFDHYLLLPRQELEAVPAWRRASAFAVTHRPVVGFSPQEAMHAAQVTIAAGHDLISSEVEASLRAAGCRVQRLTLLPNRKSACEPNGAAVANA